MSGPATSIEALVLDRRPSGESLQHLTLLSPQSGLIQALLRLPGSRKSSHSHLVDLLDVIQVTTKAPRVGSGVLFASQPEITRRHTAIGANYQRLESAMAYARLLARNAGHLEDHQQLFDEAIQFFSVLEQTPHPEAALLKALYRFLRREGYPVREDWLRTMSASRYQDTLLVLKSPLRELNTPVETILSLLSSLKAWTTRETDLLLD